VGNVIAMSAAVDTVSADIDFLAPGPERVFSYGYDPGPGAPPASTAFESHRVRIHDVRRWGPLTLEGNGAVLLQAPTAVRNFYEDDLESGYYPESAELIRAALGASRVVVFDHNLRRGSRLALRPDRYDQGRPVHHAHTDFTESSAARRLRDEYGGGARELIRGRYLQVNLWRPIRAPLRDAPLAICDGATVNQHSLRPADLRYPDRCGEIYYLSHSPGQVWFFASDMGTDEAWLFKNFDSAPSGAGWVAPHSAFEDPRRHASVAPRESIEVRAFAFFDAD
jgi:hypothetical protein